MGRREVEKEKVSLGGLEGGKRGRTRRINCRDVVKTRRSEAEIR